MNGAPSGPRTGDARGLASTARGPAPSPATAPCLEAAPGLAAATAPPEARGVARDAVRLQVVGGGGVETVRVRDLPRFLRPGDLLVANRSALRPAAVWARVVAPASAAPRTDARAGAAPDAEAPDRVLLHLAHRYGEGVWLVEPRFGVDAPGPVPLGVGTRLRVDGADGRLLGAYPGLARLRFLSETTPGTLDAACRRVARPVRYGHLSGPAAASAYATVFGDRPGSAEMASAGRPFTTALLRDLAARGVRMARITLHAGVSGLDAPPDDAELRVPPEAFEVDAATADAVNATRTEGGRVVAIGTGAVRALESAWDGARVRPVRGWTRKVLRPGASGGFLDGVITGLHDAEASHVRLLRAVVGETRVRQAYRAARDAGLLAHEFGDVQLLWSDARAE